MKTFLPTFVLLMVGQFAFGQTSKDTADVKQLAEGTVIYFYNGDMVSFANLFDTNATFIAVTGLFAKGKSQIADMHKIWKIDSATVTKYKQPIINFATKDIAVSYIVWDGLVFGEGPAKGTVQSGYLTIVSQRTKSGWKIISATNALNFRGLKNFDLKPYSGK